LPFRWQSLLGNYTVNEGAQVFREKIEEIMEDMKNKKSIRDYRIYSSYDEKTLSVFSEIEIVPIDTPDSYTNKSTPRVGHAYKRL
jgi:hypothetical protein